MSILSASTNATIPYWLWVYRSAYQRVFGNCKENKTQGIQTIAHAYEWHGLKPIREQTAVGIHALKRHSDFSAYSIQFNVLR